MIKLIDNAIIIIMKFAKLDCGKSWWIYVVWAGVSLMQMPMIFFREIKHLKVKFYD